MEVTELFLTRYVPLREYWIGSLFDTLNESQMRRRPHPRMNSIAWLIWHVARAEDAGINRFVAETTQVLERDDWNAQLNVPYRSYGTGMNANEVVAVSNNINLEGLRDYYAAVSDNTIEFVQRLDPYVLDEVLMDSYIDQVLFDEGLAGDHAAWLRDSFTDWTRGKCLMHFGLSHPYQHIGEIAAVGTLLGVNLYND